MSRVKDRMHYEGPVKFSGTVYGKTATVIAVGTTATVYNKRNKLFTFTPTDNQDCTLSAESGGLVGQEITIIFVCQGTADEVMTFGTNFHSVGTLTLDTTAARYYLVSFISNGTAFFEKSRTAVQT
jgi:hypothetical protein